MGVPVISADVGGQKELINENVGIIVPCIQKEEEIRNFNYTSKEVLSYVDGIQKILNNLDEYKKNCRTRILSGFTLDNMIERMCNEFQKIAKEPNLEKKQNGYGLKANIRITKELLAKFLLQSEGEYNWASATFNTENIHMMTKYDKTAKREQFYEQTIEYKMKHPIVVILRKIGIYDTLKRIIGWEKK